MEEPGFSKDAVLEGLCFSSLAAGTIDRFHAGVMEGRCSVATRPLQASGKVFQWFFLHPTERFSVSSAVTTYRGTDLGDLL